MSSKYFDILLPVPTDGVYTYRSAQALLSGQRVLVPFGSKRSLAGICLKEAVKPEFDCKDITEVLDDAPCFSPAWLELLQRLADYYIAPLGATLHGVISQKILAAKPPEHHEAELCMQAKPEPVTLLAEQAAVAANIALDGYSTHLIQGITGSGKTEIYLDLMQKIMAKGKQTLYLVPEISLTPQLIDRLAARLGFKPLVYHSKLTDKRRNEAFWAWVRNEHPLLLGARSALFVPSEHIGLIIVDEEHESSFKQEETPSYHLRDMAVLYA
ncbi:MAG: DEAD/DEAH box helicase family protein, partial [Deferribacteraceae bacterium]|nr:DEAD/DEAH box helicase family protein [Deferribacteraceae bacterium]